MVRSVSPDRLRSRDAASSTLSINNPGVGSPGIVLPATPSPSTPIRNADLSVAPLSSSIAVDSTVQFVATAKVSGAEIHWSRSLYNTRIPRCHATPQIGILEDGAKARISLLTVFGLTLSSSRCV